MPGADGVFNGFPHAFRAGSQNDGGDSDHFRVLVGDHVADDGLVALFLHIIEQEVGIRPVFRGEGENVQFDLQQVAEILGNDGQGLETKQQEKHAWDAVSGVNITLGLPIIRVSVDHGTAFDQAGTGTASELSLRNSIEYAVMFANNRK